MRDWESYMDGINLDALNWDILQWGQASTDHTTKCT